ncbi:metallophosphoesterase [Chitinophaga sp.]|uniref:metallophosphoesterase family protein n=1 Tax=Chitinophaga sp. TaxID=1869181 RepID=UPI0031D8B860
MKNIHRRQFLLTMGALSAALPLGAAAFRFTPRPGNAFSFLLLGDLHFDKPEHHDMQYVRQFYPNDIGQIENYCRITRENFPGLMQAAKERATAMKADFWLQLGDFVEGLCGSETLAARQTQDFIDYVKNMQLERPFFVVKGNHDITGQGAREVYHRTVLPWQQQVLKNNPVSGANATFVYKNTRFVIFDCYTADESLVWLQSVLSQHREERLFFCVHQPVVPYNARANWHVFAKPAQQQKRELLLNLLGKHKAIVLTAHLHKTSILTRRTPGGSFVQVGLGSVVPAPDAPVKDHLQGIDKYNADLLQLEPSFTPSSFAERKENIEKEAPFIRHFEYADFCGYGAVNISEDGEMELEIYRNMDSRPWSKVDLSGLLREGNA